MNLIDLLEKAAAKNGKKTFLIEDKKKPVSFGDTRKKVIELASGLSKLGVKKGERVALLLNNSPEFIYSYFAAQYLGAEIIPLNTFLRLEEIIYILNDSNAVALITSPDFYPVLKDFSISRANRLKHIISTGDLKEIKCLNFQQVLSDTPFTPAVPNDTDTAAIIYTSGTTGHPKGAMLTHSNLVSNVEQSIKAINIKPSDRFIIFLPMFHAFSFTVCVLIPLYVNCKLTIIKSIQPFSNIIKAIMKDRISIFVAIPPVYNVLAGKKIPGWLLWLNPIRLCISGAAPLAGEVLKNFEKKFRVPLMEGYGLSEASPVVSVNPFDNTRKAGSVGKPIPDVEVRIVDENGKDVTPGSAGEIVIKGPNIMKGYYNRETETAEVLKDGWLFTGDIGRIDTDGYLFIMDRKKDLILVNGMNLYPREVEEVLYRHPAVADAAVVPKKDSVHGEIPIGVILLKEGASATDAELRKFCKPHLANFKVPHRFEFWAEIPRNATGKILKREIKRIINEQQQG